jgi:hypothetical protein
LVTSAFRIKRHQQFQKIDFSSFKFINNKDESFATIGITCNIMPIHEQIVNAEQTLKQLSLQRQLQEIREERREANQRHRGLVDHYMQRMTESSQRCHAILSDMYKLSDYMSVVADYYNVNPGSYVLRKHSQLLMFIRSNHILDNYHQLTVKVYEKIVEGLEETKHDLLQDIRELKNQRDDQAYLIQEQAVMLVTSRITSYYDAKNKSNHGEQTISRHTSVLQKLISKKANQRLLHAL